MKGAAGKSAGRRRATKKRTGKKAALRIDRAESRRLEREIRLLGHALASSGECITIADPQDRLIFVNDTFLRTYGYSREELLGESIDLLRSSRNDPAVTNRILPATLEGGWKGELWNRRKDGSEFPIRLSTSVMRDEKGRAVATVGVATDITEQKRAEATLEEARRAAEAASEAKSQFLANISHEIRTPMNGILGMAGLLLDTALTPAQQEMAEAVRTSTESLLSIINDILDFSSIEAGKVKIEPTPFDLRAALDDVAGLLMPRADAAGIELAMLYDRRAPFHFVGDAGRIRQIFLNLVGNAVKFTPNGHVLVEARAIGQSDGVTEMRIAVRDTGIGIPPDKLPLLFRSFSQVDATSARRHEGTGLGLAISKALTDLMGGSVTVFSRPGEGSSFTVTLPLELAPACASPAPDAGELEGISVLIAGDRELSRATLTELCAGWKMRPIEAQSLEDAAVRLASSAGSSDAFRVVLVDCSGHRHCPERFVQALEVARIPAVIVGDPRRRPSQCPVSDVCPCAWMAWPVRHAKLRQTLLNLLGAPESAVGPGRTELVAAPMSDAASRPPALAGRRALLVEDNAINQKVGCRLLQKLGFEVTLASNGLEGIEAAEQRPFDVILMDCQMPEMDGFEATRRLRASEAARHTPIFAMTAHAMESDRQACLAAGMNGYVTKPVRLEELRQILEQQLGPVPEPPCSTRRD